MAIAILFHTAIFFPSHSLSIGWLCLITKIKKKPKNLIGNLPKVRKHI